MGKLSRNKGLNFERQIAQAFRGVFKDVRRLLENHKDDANGVDLLHTGHYKIQCKRFKKYASLSAIKEVTADELMGEVPVLITKGDNERVLVAIPLEEFIRLLELSK